MDEDSGVTEPYCVWWRSGGERSCVWRRTEICSDRAHAERVASSIQTMGYKTIVRAVAESNTVGPPIGWEWRLVDWDLDKINVTGDRSEWTSHTAKSSLGKTPTTEELKAATENLLMQIVGIESAAAVDSSSHLAAVSDAYRTALRLQDMLAVSRARATAAERALSDQNTIREKAQ